MSQEQRVKQKRICPQGHTYYKSSNCPACPFCEQQRKPAQGFMATLSAPAMRALEAKGISTLEQLAGFTEKEILSLHGMGKATMPKLRSSLQAAGLTFKQDKQEP